MSSSPTKGKEGPRLCSHRGNFNETIPVGTPATDCLKAAFSPFCSQEGHSKLFLSQDPVASLPSCLASTLRLPRAV